MVIFNLNAVHSYSRSYFRRTDAFSWFPNQRDTSTQTFIWSMDLVYRFLGGKVIKAKYQYTCNYYYSINLTTLYLFYVHWYNLQTE